MEVETTTGAFQLSKAQKVRIIEAQQEAQSGATLTEEQADNAIAECLIEDSI